LSPSRTPRGCPCLISIAPSRSIVARGLLATEQNRLSGFLSQILQPTSLAHAAFSDGDSQPIMLRLASEPIVELGSRQLVLLAFLVAGP
jgi:hypothetical protein